MVVHLWTDGSSSGTSQAPGGWAFILRYGEHAREGSGSHESTTNNRMELTAAIEGLRALSRPCSVLVHTDSEYVMKAFTCGWIQKWERKNWHNVKNKDLWDALIAEVVKHQVNWEWHRGHSGIPDNERVDELAKAAKIANAPPPEDQWRHQELFHDEHEHLDEIAADVRALGRRDKFQALEGGRAA